MQDQKQSTVKTTSEAEQDSRVDTVAALIVVLSLLGGVIFLLSY